MRIERRQLLGWAVAAASIVTLDSVGWAQTDLRGFTHGVASGKPGVDQTRFVSSQDVVRLIVEISDLEDFAGRLHGVARGCLRVS